MTKDDALRRAAFDLDVYIKSKDDMDLGRTAKSDDPVVPGDTIIFSLNQIELLPPE